MRSSLVCLSMIVMFITGCASNVIAPSYQTSNPNMQVGGESPANVGPTLENAGSFCLELNETWHNDGKTSDGQALWAKDTTRRVVPCGK
jgi:hypothetical protein